MIITNRNNAPISNYGGDFRCKKVKSKHFRTVFKKIEKNKKKNDGKTGHFTQYQFSTKSILNSDRSDECIDFTMLCVFFFLCLCTRESVEIMLQFQNMGVVSCSKINLVGVLGSVFEFPNSFQKRREKPKKN
ncbi:Uncharacterized protein FWK35_00031479, partial [Aphis craccivora]